MNEGVIHFIFDIFDEYYAEINENIDSFLPFREELAKAKKMFIQLVEVFDKLINTCNQLK